MSNRTGDETNADGRQGNSTYVKLREILWQAFYPGEPMYSPDTGEIRSMYKKIDTALDALWPEINRLEGVEKLMRLYSDKLQDALRLLIPCIGRVDTTGFTDTEWTAHACSAILLYREPDQW